MRSRGVNAFILIVAGLTPPTAARAAAVEAGLERSRVYLGTNVDLIVQVTDAPAAAPEFQDVDGVDIQRTPRTGVQRDLIAGTVTRVYRYRLTPRRAGTFKIGPVTVEIEGQTVSRGPYELQVVEAPVRFVGAKLEQEQILPGETTQLVLGFQGHHPATQPAMPAGDGLSIRSAGAPRINTMNDAEVPVTIYPYLVTGLQLGSYRIAGIGLNGVPVDHIALTVAPISVVQAQAQDHSLEVGGHTLVLIGVRGLDAAASLSLVAPPGLKVEPSPQPVRTPPGVRPFVFDVTALEPGSMPIAALKVSDGTQVALPEPVVLMVRQAGQPGILSCRGTPRSEQTVLGEPFIVDYEVFFRGDLRRAAVDPGGAGFANQPFIKVDPVNDLAYPGWEGHPLDVQFGSDATLRVLSGTAELNGRKEQLLRFALRITPLATGELSLDGLKVIVACQVTKKTSGPMIFSEVTTQERYEEEAKTPPHRVADPPGLTPPPGFRGAVGTFTFETALDRTTAAAMSPLTLTMRITGDTVGPQLKPPPLTDVPELTRDFDVSPTVGGGDVDGDTITFTQVLRPRHEKVEEVPALPLVHFDSTKNKYATTYSLPIPIEVTAGRVVGASAMQDTEATQPAAAGENAAEHEDRVAAALGANRTTLGQIVPPEPAGVAPVIAVLLAGPIGVALVVAGERAYRRRRPAAGIREQKRRVRASLGDLDASDAFHDRLARAMHEFLRLSLDLPPGEPSIATLEDAFANRGVSAELRGEAHALLARCDEGRFAVGGVDPREKAELLDRARRLFDALDRRT